MNTYTYRSSPVGPLTLAADDHDRLCQIAFDLRSPSSDVEPESSRSSRELCETERRGARGCDHESGVIAEAMRQLDEYFAGRRREFELDLAPQGTPFQLAVWDALRTIPYGATASYGDIARSVDRPNAVRAVGQANGRNPLAIVVPCHRVVGSDRSLTGYGGGIERKRFLLALEGAPLTAALDL
jgi:methylated-DNA-[protein]-cysteine S-methyltransferase